MVPLTPHSPRSGPKGKTDRSRALRLSYLVTGPEPVFRPDQPPCQGHARAQDLLGPPGRQRPLDSAQLKPLGVTLQRG